MRKIRAGRERLLAVADPRVCREQGRKPRRETLRRFEVRRRRDVIGVGEVERQGGAPHAQRVDRRHLGAGPHHIERLLRQRAQGRELAPQSLQLVPGGQRPPPEEMGRRFEAHAPGQLLELVAADDQLASVPIDVAQAGPGGHHAVKPACR